MLLYAQNSPSVIDLGQNRLHHFSDAAYKRIPDFSHAGYMVACECLDRIPVRKTLGPVDGDNTPHIQRAIDEISSRKPDENRLRGAVLVEPGLYSIRNNLFIRASGVVLRGS